MAQSADNLVWIDMEMTGLDPDREKVLEIATIITDGQLNLLAEGPVIAIHQSDEVLNAMDDWCTKTHGESGLTERCRQSHINEQQASEQTLTFLNDWVPKGASPLCGNSIGQDRRFMVRHMPQLEAWFHYRNVDVSTIKELVRRWKPELLNQFHKKGTHQALDDIRESIAELQFYRQHVFCI